MSSNRLPLKSYQSRIYAYARIISLLSIIAVIVFTAGCSSSSSSAHNRYLYVTNAFSYDISQFMINPDGSLSTLGANVQYSTNSSGFPGSESLTFDPSHTHAYLANLGASTIDVYTVNGDGTLTRSGTTTLDQGANASEPSVLVFSPNGKYAYATSESATNHKLTEYSVNADGSLTLMTALDTGSDVGYIIVDPQDRYLYVTSYFANTIAQYALMPNGTVGAKLATLPTGSGPFAAILSPDGAHLYVTNLGTLRPPYSPVPGTITEYSVAGDGSLSSIGTVIAGTGPGFLTINSDGTRAYVGNLHDSTVMTYTINNNGTLTLMQTLTLGNGPVQVTLSPSGRSAYIGITGVNPGAATNANTIAICNLDAQGLLHLSTYVPAGIGPDFLLAQ